MHEKLKVYSGPMPQGSQSVPMIIAAKNKTEARKLAGISAGRFNNFWSETRNDADCEAALAEPRKLLASPRR